MFKKVLIIGLAVVVLAATSLTAFAFTGVSTPAEIVANLTGKSVEEVTEEKFESDKTYGQIAYDEGLWEEFNEEMLNSKKAFLDEKVADGTLTQEEADEIYTNILERQEYCNGNGTGGYGGMMGYGFGNGGRGQGLGQGRGCGRAWQ
ncbi:MAG: hypothetical protein AB7V48_12865 [Sedimentibacter sp.]